MARILAVDDEPDLLDTVRRVLVRAGHEVVTAPSGTRAVPELPAVDLVITDLMMPGLDGMGLLGKALELPAPPPVVMMTAFATLENAVAAMRAGAWDYLAKPFSPEQLRVVVERALGHRALRDENRRLRAALSGPPLVGECAAMLEVAELIRRVAPTQLGVLITGESGTGKEVVARALHAGSARAAAPFVPVDCGAIPPNLVESELFGHDRGAFTGAEGERKGLVEEAEGGTFFLDEIGDLDPGAQTRLLRLLQEGEFRRVGSNKLRKANIRVLAATNRKLEDRVQSGQFREDLFHRLNVVRVHLPPLREREGDAARLFAWFVERFRVESGRGALELGSGLLAKLAAYGWPGNVRELSNVARYVAGLAQGPVAEAGDLPPSLGRVAPAAGPAPAGPVTPAVDTSLPYAEAKRLWVDSFDEAYFDRLLDAHQGNISAAARAADIDRKTIQRFLRRKAGEDDAG